MHCSKEHSYSIILWVRAVAGQGKLMLDGSSLAGVMMALQLAWHGNRYIHPPDVHQAKKSMAIHLTRAGPNWRTLCSPKRNRKYEGCSPYSAIMMRAQVCLELG
jgi:hypothetical protein